MRTTRGMMKYFDPGLTTKGEGLLQLTANGVSGTRAKSRSQSKIGMGLRSYSNVLGQSTLKHEGLGSN